MASLKDTVNLTSQLTDLTNQLHGELTEGDVDFEKMIKIADEISEHADSLAAAFTRVNEALRDPLQPSSENGSGDGGNASRASAGSRRRSTAGSTSGGNSSSSGSSD
jgi:hypothetical protein